MGMDTVEMVMAIEETFDITIPNEQAEKIVTVGDAYRYILSRVKLDDSSPCLTASAFYRIRRALVDTVGVGREQVRPASSVDDLIPREGRREHWERLGRSLGVTLPELIRPAPIRASLDMLFRCWLLGVLIVVGAFLFGSAGIHTTQTAIAGLVSAGVFALILGYHLTQPFAVELAPTCATVRGLTLTLSASLWGATVRSGERTWNRESVWVVLRQLVSEQAGVSLDVITEETSFVYDLGMD
jgi:acyl carrier protein